VNAFEHLEDVACKDGIDVTDRKLGSERIKGLYCDGYIVLNTNALKTTTEKTCVLAEELGHHYTTTGNILDQQEVTNIKQELHARTWAYNECVGLIGIIKAFETGCKSLYEMADYLDVTEDFLKDALESYRRKYGIYTEIDNYIIFFEPWISIMRKF